MMSTAKAAANAANAKLSTGPSSVEGKARSSRNAIRHGLTSRDVVVSEGQREEFETLCQSLLDELDPEGVLEVLTFNQALHAAWNLLRVLRLEAGLAVDGSDPLLDASAAMTLDRLGRYAARAERAYYRAIAELRALQTNRALRDAKLEPGEAEQVPAAASINDLTKQTHGDVSAKAMELALQMVDYETGIFSLIARGKYCQNQLPASAENPPVAGVMTAAA